jgi:hypothetical protein
VSRVLEAEIMSIVAWMACLRLVFMHVTWSHACCALLAETVQEKINPLGEFLLVVSLK